MERKINMRELKGLQIAKTSRISRTENGWLVPSQSGHGKYFVKYDGNKLVCNCPDYQLRGTCRHSNENFMCKHCFAVEFTIKQEIDQEGNQTLTKTMRVTYPQNWSIYNKVQCQEQESFMRLLHELSKEIEEPEYKFGRPRIPLREIIFASVFKVYSTFSLRRFISMMNVAKEKDYIDQIPHFTLISKYLEKPELTPLLNHLIEVSSLPLKSIETDFAIDSSGFSTSRFSRWFNYKHRKDPTYRYWLKAHLMCGTKTQVVTSVEITDGTAPDSKMLPELVQRTSNNFNIQEVSGDKVYSTKTNLRAIDRVGAKAFIPFKKNTTGKSKGSMLWRKMWFYFLYRHDEFLEHYHKRSKVETTFQMIKSKFGQAVRSRNKTAQINEILCKVLCHNLCVVNHEMYELGIELNFYNYSFNKRGDN